GLARGRVELEGRRVEREAVVLARDVQRLAEAGPARAEEPLVVQSPAGAHPLQPVRRLERADQNRARRALRLADEVEAPVDAVGAVDVRVAGRPEHHGVPLGAAAKAVAGRVLVVVGLNLDASARADGPGEMR